MAFSRDLVVALGSVGLLFVAGCSADAADGAGAAAPVDVSGEGTAEDDVTAMKYYDCRGGDSNDSMSRLEIGLGATKLDVTDLSKDAAPPDSGKIDRDYNPSAQYAGAVRFLGWEKILTSFGGGDVAHIEFIVSKEIKAKQAAGKIWMRTSGSGGDTTQFSCKAKAGKLKVDAAKKARLACSIQHLICTHDNPPGDTCLSDVFLNQTSDDEATLKLTYLDHFGVHVVERKVPLAASALQRTTKKVEGTWAGNHLELDHRGGVTYTGTFKLPGSGGSSEVQCNDLAMFD